MAEPGAEYDNYVFNSDTGSGNLNDMVGVPGEKVARVHHPGREEANIQPNLAQVPELTNEAQPAPAPLANPENVEPIPGASIPLDPTASASEVPSGENPQGEPIPVEEPPMQADNIQPEMAQPAVGAESKGWVTKEEIGFGQGKEGQPVREPGTDSRSLRDAPSMTSISTENRPMIVENEFSAKDLICPTIIILLLLSLSITAVVMLVQLKSAVKKSVMTIERIQHGSIKFEQTLKSCVNSTSHSFASVCQDIDNIQPYVTKTLGSIERHKRSLDSGTEEEYRDNLRKAFDKNKKAFDEMKTKINNVLDEKAKNLTNTVNRKIDSIEQGIENALATLEKLEEMYFVIDANIDNITALTQHATTSVTKP